jgi:acetyl-CoA carboxylase biotin carboxyl carrier protein
MSENTGSAKAQEKEASTMKKGSESGKKQSRSANPSFNMAELRELAELVNEHGFTDFEFENENIRVRLSKMVAAPVVQATPQYAPAPAPTSPQTSVIPEPLAAEADSDEGLLKITSPIVGTFYRSPGPDKDPYVKEGAQVGPDTIVCIVEAMKLMNEIQAEVSGEIVKVYVENGQPVEYGQPLFGIKQ